MCMSFAEAGADIITVHPEAGPHLHRTLQLIKSLGKKAGVALNPATPVDALDYVWGDIDLVLVMSVNPGFGGQAFLDSPARQDRALRRRIDETGRIIDLEVDGGINHETARRATDAGADVLVAGTASFSGGPAAYAENIRRLRALMAGAGFRRVNRLLRLPPGVLRGRLVQASLAPLYASGLYAHSLPGRGGGAIQPVGADSLAG